MGPLKMKQVINGKAYNTETSVLLAGNDWWDGFNFERGGRQMFLYKTARGNYFTQNLTQWQGEVDYLEPVDKTEAKRLFESLYNKRCEWEDAFDELPEQA